MLMMQYLSELVLAQLEHKKPGNIPDGIPIEELETIAHRNHMNNLILGSLLKTDIPEEKKADLKPFVMRSAMISMAQVGCLKELEKRFEEEGIYHHALKGAVLKGLYPSPEMREMSDIDVMIYDVNLDRAKKVVEDMGYTLAGSEKHHDIYVKSSYMMIELHNALYDKNVDKNQYEYFKSQKQLIAKEGKTYALKFTTEDFYVYLIAHMAKHFYETGCGIRNLVDVYYYRKLYETSWKDDIVKKELDKCGLAAFEKRIQTLSKVWLGGQKSDPFSEALFDYMSECGIYGKGENGIWGQFAMQNQNDSINYQSYAKRWYYFPPISYMEGDYPWLKKYPYLLAVAWGIRGVHGLFSKDGREKRKMLMTIHSEDVRKINNIYKGMQLQFKKD